MPLTWKSYAMRDLEDKNKEGAILVAREDTYYGAGVPQCYSCLSDRDITLRCLYIAP